jgi:hypothetical protein
MQSFQIFQLGGGAGEVVEMVEGVGRVAGEARSAQKNLTSFLVMSMPRRS